jgi:hypothetical protein
MHANLSFAYDEFVLFVLVMLEMRLFLYDVLNSS